VDLAELDIAAFLTALTQMAGRHNIEVPSTVTTVGRALVTLEGLLDEFIPDVNMIEIISDHIATSKSLKNATKDEIKSLGVEGHQALHATLGTMTELKTVARMLTRGQLRVNMELVGSEEPFQLLSDMVNRLTMALIVVGLFVGSSIVYYAGMKPIIFGIPVIGFMGYVVAFALGVWIVIDIYLKGRKTRSGRVSIDISPAGGGFALDKAAGYVVDTVMRVAVDGIDQVSCRTPSDGTRCLVSSLMRGLLCSALDAVAKETPAKAATSSSRAARPVNVWAIMPRFLV